MSKISNFEIVGIKNVSINGVELPQQFTSVEQYETDELRNGRCMNGINIGSEMLGKDIKKWIREDSDVYDKIQDDVTYSFEVTKEV